MTATQTLEDFRASLNEFKSHMDRDQEVASKIALAANAAEATTKVPGLLESAVSGFQNAIKLSDPIVAALGAAPYGIGTAVKRADQIAEDVIDALEPTRARLEAIDKRLEPVGEALDWISDRAANAGTLFAGAELWADTTLDTVDLMETSVHGRLGDGLVTRIEAHARFADGVSAAHDFLEPAETIVDQITDLLDQSIGLLPEDIVETAAETAETVFGPISNAFESIERTICNTFTVIPGIPAAYINTPFGRVQVTPEIPAVRVNICDVLTTIDNLIGVVRNFVEDKILDALAAVGIDLFGAIDRMKDKLLEPFEALMDAVDDALAALPNIEALISDALDAVGRFFDDITEYLAELPQTLFDEVHVGTAGDDFMEGTAVYVPLVVGIEEPTVSDALFGQAGDDTMLGMNGDDFLFGGAGDDSLDGGSGDDELYGGEGADSFVFRGDFGDDFVSDGTGGERFEFPAGTQLSAQRVGETDLLLVSEGTDQSVLIEGWFEAGRYADAVVTVGGEPVDLGAGMAPGNPAPITGTDGDDRFEFAAPAAREVDGAAGTDTVAYAISRREVDDRVLEDGRVEIRHEDGTVDLLTDVERVEFTDGTFLFDLRAEADSAYRLYSASLGRAPDEAGLRAWDAALEAGGSLVWAAERFLDSGEFAARFASAVPEAEDYVEAFYENVLGRVADGDGFDFWVDVLETGLMEAADVLVAFANGPENVANQEENYDDGFLVA